jgi:hypothetical protein
VVPALDQTFGGKPVDQTNRTGMGEADTDRERSN